MVMRLLGAVFPSRPKTEAGTIVGNPTTDAKSDELFRKLLRLGLVLRWFIFHSPLLWVSFILLNFQESRVILDDLPMMLTVFRSDRENQQPLISQTLASDGKNGRSPGFPPSQETWPLTVVDVRRGPLAWQMGAFRTVPTLAVMAHRESVNCKPDNRRLKSLFWEFVCRLQSNPCGGSFRTVFNFKTWARCSRIETIES